MTTERAKAAQQLEQLISVGKITDYNEETGENWATLTWSVDLDDVASRDWEDVVAVAADGVRRKVAQEFGIKDQGSIHFTSGPDEIADINGNRHVQVEW